VRLVKERPIARKRAERLASPTKDERHRCSAGITAKKHEEECASLSNRDRTEGTKRLTIFL
jgi:hypothetical protein